MVPSDRPTWPLGAGETIQETHVKIRALLTVGAAVAVVGSGVLAGQGSASATGAAVSGSTGQVTVGAQIAGVVPALHTGLGAAAGTGAGKAGAAAGAVGAAAASCAEPNCDLTYHYGPIQRTPKVYLLFWGPKWNSDSTAEAARNYLISFYRGLGKDGWSLTAAQYGDPSGHHPTFGTALLAGYGFDTNNPYRNVTLDDLGKESLKGISLFHISDTNDAEVILAAQPGTCFAPVAQGGPTFAGSCGQVQGAGGYCAFHDYDYGFGTASQFLPWVNLPFQLDAGTGCGQNFINTGSAGTLDGFSIVAGHETTETITDPELSAWYDQNDLNYSGGEIADKCAWEGIPFFGTPTDPAGDLTLSTGTFAMQSLWSNALGKCVMNGGLPLSVTTPAAQQSTVGKGIVLTIHATLGGHAPLSFRAWGLPAGLSINSKTGVIGGTLNVTAGTYAPRVVVSYYAGWKTISFGWKVSSTPGEIKGYASKCVDDHNGSTANGNMIDISACNGWGRQLITFTATRELQVLGKCVTGGSSAYLEPCTGAAGQIWTRQSNGEYVLASSGACLTDPSDSTANGTRLTLAACKNTANQHWSLP
jgi:hypothetical protein